MYGKNYEQIIHIFRHEFRRFFPCISITVSKYTIPPLASLHPIRFISTKKVNFADTTKGRRHKDVEG